MAEEAPPGVMRGVDLAAFRAGRLVGTVDEVREQVAQWEALGVETLIAGVGAVPFHVARRDDVEMLGHALRP
jgi:alkanesulfonate monooxygenase SsuD/methylene tetrahydromethanopterin reductase-like flavin-dependent oxidoreductase (luciferase family)